MSENPSQNPLEFIRTMWGHMGFSLPGMVTPTLDIKELDKRITDLKAVEGWLTMNLNMLQMTTQGLEMQRAALAAVQEVMQHTIKNDQPNKENNDSAFTSIPIWPWNLMNPVQETANENQKDQKSEQDSQPAPATPASRRKTNAKKDKKTP